MKIWDLEDFFTISRYKNGNLKISLSIDNKANIYKLLKEKGFGFFIYENDFKFCRKVEGEIKFTRFSELNYYFVNEYLQNQLLFNNEKFSVKDFMLLLEEIYSNNIEVIKNDNLFKYYLYFIPNKEEEHQIKLELDNNYKLELENGKFISFFKKNNYESTIDLKSGISKDNLIYFTKTKNKNCFIIFNKYGNSYDCWFAKFKSEKSIGNETPLSLDEIRVGFQLDSDIALLHKYLN
ncbi:hypothetical protein MQX03_06225 [Chryseobacterium aahli]|uniref:hypothetical protein n=1 Tax=Chryseobacterium aahli TaxID=1278643 RepID=UPI001F61D226|nr:hypothetical protein [Chryseobacterium aahli]MCI3936787.1 hypothetical protein [Chryseobacterium aahli]